MGDAHLTTAQSSAQQLGVIVARYQLGPQVTMRWEKIDNELSQIYRHTGGLHSVTHDNQRDISATSAADGTCTAAVGQARADRLVQECLQVSAVTHPPYNARNSCAMILDKIKCGCALLDARDRPAFFSEYK